MAREGRASYTDSRGAHSPFTLGYEADTTLAESPKPPFDPSNMRFPMGSPTSCAVVVAVSLFGCQSVSESPWRPLIEPGSLDGWHAAPGGDWQWRGDVLVGTSENTEKRHGLVISDGR